MKSKLILALLLLTIGIQVVNGQNFFDEFGRIRLLNFEKEQYAAYQNAEAVVLFDVGKSYFVRSDNTYDVVFERITRIIVLNDAGTNYAEVEIPFYHEGSIWEIVSDIEAYSYNNDNGLKISKLETSNIFTEKLNDLWSAKKFAVPNVKAGSIIEYRYKILSEYKFNLRDWEFQWKIPVIHSEYETKMTPFYEYTWLLQGTTKLTEQISEVEKGLEENFAGVKFNPNVFRFVLKDVPAFESEEFITSINDYIIKIDFQLSKINYPSGGSLDIITTWENMLKEYDKNENFGKYVRKAEKLAAKIFENEDIWQKSEKEKFDFAVDYAKEKFSWNGINSRFASKSPSEFLKDKHGNSADINLFTVGMLNALGVKTFPVLISTRNHGKIRFDYPFTHFFDYVILLVSVNGTHILSDATEVLSLNDRIPARCINDKGLIMADEKVNWVGLECQFPSEIRTDIVLEISEADSLKAQITKTATEYDALYYRNNYTEKHETIRKKLESTEYILDEQSISVQNQLDRTKPYILTFRQSGILPMINNKIFISPFLDESIADNPLKQKSRTYPVDITYPKKRILQSIIKIPKGYKVEYLPPNQKINNIMIGINYSSVVEGDSIIITLEHQLRKTVFQASEFNIVKYYFDEVVKKSNDKIVLSKILE